MTSLHAVDPDYLKPEGRIDRNSYDRVDRTRRISRTNIRVWFDNFYNSKLGGYAFMRFNSLPFDKGTLSYEAFYGLSYEVKFGNKQDYQHYHPYMVNNGWISGVTTTASYKDFIRASVLYMRLSGVASRNTNTGTISASNIAYDEFPFGEWFDNKYDAEEYVDMYGGSWGLDFENIIEVPYLSSFQIPFDLVRRMDSSLLIVKRNWVGPNKESTLLGVKEADLNKHYWKIAIHSPFRFNQDIKYQANEECHIYSVKLLVKLVGREKPIIYQHLDGMQVITLDGETNGVDRFEYIEVNRNESCVFHISLIGIPGGIENIEKADIILEIANNYIVQLREEKYPGFLPIRNDSVGYHYPHDVVALNNKQYHDNVRRYVRFSIGEIQSRKLWHYRIEGTVFFFDYEYSFVFNEVYRRLPSRHAKFESNVDFGQFFVLEGSILDGLVEYDMISYYVTGRYTTETLDVEGALDEDGFPTRVAGVDLVVDDDDEDGFEDSKGTNRGGRAYSGEVDQDRNGILDEEQELLITDVLPGIFYGLIDDNHNYQPDSIEDDTRPNYAYGLDVFGGRYNIGLNYEVLGRLLNFSLSFHKNTYLSTGHVNDVGFYSVSISDATTYLGELIGIFKHDVYIRDNVRDTTPRGVDKLLFRDASLMSINLQQIKNLDFNLFTVSLENYYYYAQQTRHDFAVDEGNIIHQNAYLGRLGFFNYFGEWLEVRNHFVYISKHYRSDVVLKDNLQSQSSSVRNYYRFNAITTPGDEANLILGYYTANRRNKDTDNDFYTREYSIQYRFIKDKWGCAIGANYNTTHYSGLNYERRLVLEANPLNSYNVYMQVILY